MAIAEATHKRGLVANLEDLLNVLELERALAHVVLWIQRVINAGNSAGLIHALRNPWVEVVGLAPV